MPEADAKPEMTFGGRRVRVSFNPSKDNTVDWYKGKTADIIDQLEAMRPAKDSEQARLIALAQTTYEEAAMWAVKAATA